jgi:predicted Zn-dependent protease
LQCIICHTEIIEKIDSYEECPNGHAAHTDCLREWLTNSYECPLCNTRYSDEIIEKHKDYIKKVEQQKEDELKQQQEQENREKIKEIAKEILFLKILKQVEENIAQQNYTDALNLVEGFNKKFPEYKENKIMFLRGKINFLNGRYDMCINILFKLVKEDFDYPEAFDYLGRAYETLGLEEKAQWAFERANK